MTIGDLVATLRLDIGQFKSGATQSEGILQKMGGSLGGLVAKGAALGAGFMGVSAIVSTAKWGFQIAAEAEQAKVAFGTLLGSSEAAEQMMRQLSSFAASTPFEMPEITTAAKQLVAFGISAGEVEPTLKMLGDLAAGTGQPLGELADLFGKAKVQGRLFGEDINQLTGRGIPVIGALAAQFGVAESEVKKLVEEGRVGFPELQTALASMTGEGGKFSGMMEAQSQTLSGVWSTMTDTISQTLGQFFSWLSEKMMLREIISGVSSGIETVVSITQWGFNNWQLAGELAFAYLKLGLVSLWADFGHLLGVNLPELVTWWSKEFVNVGATMFDAYTTVLINFGTTVRSVFSALWEFISSGGTKLGKVAWTPLFEGFHNSISSLPKFTEREMNSLETELSKDVARLSGIAGQSYAEFTKKPEGNLTGGLAELQKTIATPTSTAGKSSGGANGGPLTALAGSSEAYNLIRNAGHQQQESQEQLLRKKAEQQLSQAKKQTELLTTIAAAVSNPPAIEEVDF